MVIKKISLSIFDDFKRKVNFIFDYRRYLFIYVFVMLIFVYIFYRLGFFTAFSKLLPIYTIPFFLLSSLIESYLLAIRFSLILSKTFEYKDLYRYLAAWVLPLSLPFKPVSEAMRASYYKKELSLTYGESLSAVAFENIFDTIGLIIIALISVFFIPFKEYIYNILFLVLYIIIGLIAFLVFYYLFKKLNIFINIKSKAFTIFDMIIDGFIYNVKKMGLLSFHVFALSLLISLVRWLLNIVRIYVIFLIFGVKVNFIILCGVFSVITFISGSGLLPSGLGAYEFTFVFLFSLVGINEKLSLSVVLWERVFSLWIYIILGWLFLLFSKYSLNDLRNDFINTTKEKIPLLFKIYVNTKAGIEYFKTFLKK